MGRARSIVERARAPSFIASVPVLKDTEQNRQPAPGPRFAKKLLAMPSSLKLQQLWTGADGTLCLMIEREEAPRFEICLLRGDDVLRQDRLYARASAQMLAETWRATVPAARIQPPA